MSAVAALNVVKQIQALAEGPQTPEMRACVGQVVNSLLFFLDHPDSRVRLSSSRALLKLSEGYSEEMANIDLRRARTALERTRKSIESGTADVDAEELRATLAEMLEAAPGTGASAASNASAPADDEAKEALLQESQPAPASSSTAGGRGEVVLKAPNADAKLKAAILERVVAISGVVSVTFEGEFVIVSACSAAVASDAGFLADLLAVMKTQGIDGVSLVTAGSPSSPSGSGGGGPFSGSLRSSLCPGSAVESAIGSTVAPESARAEEDDDEDEGEPAYLDDDEDEVVVSASGGAAPFGAPGSPGAGPLAGGAKWSFFSQNNWMTGRKVQEFDDDPTIAARLAKAKRREEAKKEESRSRLGFISSWLGGPK